MGSFEFEKRKACERASTFQYLSDSECNVLHKVALHVRMPLVG